MSLSDIINPYFLYIKIGFVALCVAAVLGTGLWVRSVFNERAALRQSEALLKVQVTLYQQSALANQKLQEGITNAINNIKIKSNTYVTAIDNAPVVPVPDGAHITLVHGGLLSDVPSLSTFTNGSTAIRASVTTPR